MSFARRIGNSLPEAVQRAIRARRFRNQLRSGRLSADEPEYDLLDQWVGLGDIAIDVGANYGVYTARLSDLVGPTGFVIAAEPLPRTFRFLVANSEYFPYRNAVLLNTALSDRCVLASMTVPTSDQISNVYQARLSPSGEHSVLTITGDSLMPAGRRVALIKIDTEGHELAVLRGMRELLERDHPVLIVEDSGPEITVFLGDMGYRSRSLPGSPNRIYEGR